MNYTSIDPQAKSASDLKQSLRRGVITGTGFYAPDNVVTNSYFDDLYKKDIGTFLREQRNIESRRWMSADQRTSDLILPAAEKALAKAKIKATDLDLIIVCTDTPDYISPSTAAVVQHRLGAKRAGTFDLNTACAGFVTGLDVACKYISADERYRNILVVGAYAMSKYLNFDDYKIASLFADGAGAAVVGASHDHGYLASQLFTEGEFHDYMGIYAGGSAMPLNQQVLDEKKHLLAFPKRIPPETNGNHWPKLVEIVCDRIGKAPSAIDKFFITQFNINSINETLDKLNLPREKSHNIMREYGYTGSASIGMALADACNKKLLKKGDLVVFIGSGGGMSMACLAMEWGYDEAT